LDTGENLGLAFERIAKTENPDNDFKRTDFGAFVNHSKNPNLELAKENKKFYYKTLREIKTGEELTLDYQTFPWEGKRDF
jgi:SET domain-containing protein